MFPLFLEKNGEMPVWRGGWREGGRRREERRRDRGRERGREGWWTERDVVFLLMQGNAVFDFSGTGPQVEGNCNAPRAVTLSALIYCLRCMVGHDVPLNQVKRRRSRLWEDYRSI